tara:strand:- start:4936 stop:5070 length:135 start_codon:yes stop_codon:yes gene_type:complete
LAIVKNLQPAIQPAIFLLSARHAKQRAFTARLLVLLYLLDIFNS